MVQVQSSWFPLIDRNPQKFCDIYRAGERGFPEGDACASTTRRNLHH